jgi:hypothetical protein
MEFPTGEFEHLLYNDFKARDVKVVDNEIQVDKKSLCGLVYLRMVSAPQKKRPCRHIFLIHVPLYFAASTKEKLFYQQFPISYLPNKTWGACFSLPNMCRSTKQKKCIHLDEEISWDETYTHLEIRKNYHCITYIKIKGSWP